MKYIGTVLSTVERKNRAESLIRIEGLDRPQQIAVLWSIPRSPDALADLTAGTRIIFAAREETLTQRMHTDETTGATSTILVAMGKFYDVIDDDAPAEDIYATIQDHDLEFTGTVADITDTARGNGLATLVMKRHGQLQPLTIRWPDDAPGSARNLCIGEEVTIRAAERSLSWRTDIAPTGVRAIIPQVTVTEVMEGVSDTDMGRNEQL
jgi:hypothetical protein